MLINVVGSIKIKKDNFLPVLIAFLNNFSLWLVFRHRPRFIFSFGRVPLRIGTALYVAIFIPLWSGIKIITSIALQSRVLQCYLSCWTNRHCSHLASNYNYCLWHVFLFSRRLFEDSLAGSERGRRKRLFVYSKQTLMKLETLIIFHHAKARLSVVRNFLFLPF